MRLIRRWALRSDVRQSILLQKRQTYPRALLSQWKHDGLAKNHGSSFCWDGSKQHSFSTLTALDSNVNDQQPSRSPASRDRKKDRQRMPTVHDVLASGDPWTEQDFALIHRNIDSWMALEPQDTKARIDRAAWCLRVMKRWMKKVRQAHQSPKENAFLLDQRHLLHQYWARTLHLCKFPGVKYDQALEAVDLLSSYASDVLPLIPQSTKDNTTDKAYTIVFSILRQHLNAEGVFDVAEMLLEEWLEHPKSKETEEIAVWTAFFNVVARCCGSVDDGLARIDEHWKKMISLWVEPNELAYSAYLLAITRNAGKDAGPRVENLIRNTPAIQNSIACYKRSIEAWGHSGLPDKGEEQLWNVLQLQEDGAKRDKVDVSNDQYNAFLAAIKSWSYSDRPDSVERAERLVTWMQSLHESGYTTKPDAEIFEVVLRAFAKRINSGPTVERLLRHIEQALEKQEDSLAEDVLRRMYLIALEAWKNTDDENAPGKALALLNQMREFVSSNNSQNVLKSSHYSMVVQTFTTHKRGETPELAIKLLREMQEKDDVQPDVQFYNATLYAFAHQGLVEEANFLFEEMREEADSGNYLVQPNTASYTAMLGAWSNARHTDVTETRCRELVTEMESLYDHGMDNLRPTEPIYTILIKIVGRSSPEDASDILSHMESRNSEDAHCPTPTVFSYNAVLRAWAASREGVAPQRIDSLLTTMKDLSVSNNQVAPNKASYKIAIRTWLRSGRKRAVEKAETLSKEMLELGLVSADEEGFKDLQKALDNNSDYSLDNNSDYSLLHEKLDRI